MKRTPRLLQQKGEIVQSLRIPQPKNFAIVHDGPDSTPVTQVGLRAGRAPR
jgi:hypothetical protein